MRQRDAVELGVEIRGAVEADHLLQEAAGLGGRDHDSSISRVSQSASFTSALSITLREIGGAQRRHGVDDDRAGLQRREPAGDHRRIVGGADEDAVARHDAEILDQRARQAVGPVGELLVGPQAAVADQRGLVAETLLHHAVGELDGDIQVLRIVEAGEEELRPQLRRRQVIARKCVEVSRRPEHLCPPKTCRAITIFCTSDAPS